MQEKQFLSPSEVASELGISSTTVRRLIHSGRQPAIQVSERVYRVPKAAFEMHMAGSLRTAELAPIGGRKLRPSLGQGERLPTPSRILK